MTTPIKLDIPKVYIPCIIYFTWNSVLCNMASTISQALNVHVQRSGLIKDLYMHSLWLARNTRREISVQLEHCTHMLLPQPKPSNRSLQIVQNYLLHICSWWDSSKGSHKRHKTGYLIRQRYALSFSKVLLVTIALCFWYAKKYSIHVLSILSQAHINSTNTVGNGFY